MSDARLRKIQRTQDGSVESKARLIAERLRFGDLADLPGYGCRFCKNTGYQEPRGVMRACIACGGILKEDRLEIAAFLGDEAARIVLGFPWRLGMPKPPPGLKYRPWAFFNMNFEAWARVLDKWEYPVFLRAAVAAAWAAINEACPRSDEKDLVRYATHPEENKAIKSLEGYIYDPNHWEWQGLYPEGDRPMDWAYHLDLLLWDIADPQSLNSTCFRLIGSSVLACKGKGMTYESEDKIRSAIKSDLVPWALGEGDPVADRVESRSAT